MKTTVDAINFASRSYAEISPRPPAGMDEESSLITADPDKLTGWLDDIDELKKEIQERMRRIEAVNQAKSLLLEDAIRTEALNKKLAAFGKAFGGSPFESPHVDNRHSESELLHMPSREPIVVPIHHTVQVQQTAPAPPPVESQHRFEMERPVQISNPAQMEQAVQIEQRVQIEHPVQPEHPIQIEHRVQIEHPIQIEHPVQIERTVEAEHPVPVEHPAPAYPHLEDWHPDPPTPQVEADHPVETTHQPATPTSLDLHDLAYLSVHAPHSEPKTDLLQVHVPHDQDAIEVLHADVRTEHFADGLLSHSRVVETIAQQHVDHAGPLTIVEHTPEEWPQSDHSTLTSHESYRDSARRFAEASLQRDEAIQLANEAKAAFELASRHMEDSDKAWKEAHEAVEEAKRQLELAAAQLALVKSKEEVAAAEHKSAQQDLTTAYQFAAVAAQRQHDASEYFHRSNRWTVNAVAASWIAVVWFAWIAFHAILPIWAPAIAMTLVVAIAVVVSRWAVKKE